MHVFSEVLDEDFLVELPPKSILEHAANKFQNFSGGMPLTPLVLACKGCALHNIHRSQGTIFKLYLRRSVH